MTLVLAPKTARRLAESYLPAGAELTDEIIDDVGAELVNVIAGQAKTILKETPYHYTLSIPVVSRPGHGEESSGMEISLSLHPDQIQLLIDLRPCPNA
jgi:CheY-specific phosphatase CheX